MATDNESVPHGWAVLVRFAGPTNYRGARWIATADHSIGRVVVSYDYGAPSGMANAKTAAVELLAKWERDWADRYGRTAGEYPYAIVAYGHLPNGDYVFIIG